jgi:hypothetical protein
MPDNWSFVLAAYALTALVLGGYWRRLVRRERELTALARRAQRPGRPGHPLASPAPNAATAGGPAPARDLGR